MTSNNFLRLQAGQRLSKAKLSEEFNLDNRSVQRNKSILKSLLQD